MNVSDLSKKNSNNKKRQPGMVVHIYIPSTWEIRGSLIKGHSGLHSTLLHIVQAMHRETLLIEKIEEGETFSFYYCDNSSEMHWCIKKTQKQKRDQLVRGRGSGGQESDVEMTKIYYVHV